MSVQHTLLRNHEPDELMIRSLVGQPWRAGLPGQLLESLGDKRLQLAFRPDPRT